MPYPDRWHDSFHMLIALYDASPISKEVFEKIKIPVLVMGGDEDEYSGPEENLAAHQYLPDSRLSIIPGCGHVILYCNFPAVWESMRTFLGFEEAP